MRIYFHLQLCYICSTSTQMQHTIIVIVVLVHIEYPLVTLLCDKNIITWQIVAWLWNKKMDLKLPRIGINWKKQHTVFKV